MTARSLRTVAVGVVVAAGAGLFGVSAVNVRGMDSDLRALAPVQRPLDSRTVDGFRCPREKAPSADRSQL